MKRLHALWVLPLLTLGAACGGNSFTADGSSGDDGSSSGGTSSDSSNSTGGGSSDSTSGSDGSTSSTRSSSSSTSSSSSNGSGGTGGGGSGGTASGGTASGGTGGTGSGGLGGSGGSGDGTDGSNTNDSTTGSGGSGGTGGSGGCPLTCELDRDLNGNEVCSCKRPDAECETDDDCVLANNMGVCCSGCMSAWPAELVEAEPCLVSGPNWFDANCEMPDCTDVLCPAIACEQVRYAACEDQRCVGKYECPDGTVFDHGHCVPACETADECVIAWKVDGCCADCPTPVNREVLELDPCMVPYGQEGPEECAPDPEDCAFVGCPDILCVEPGEAVCAEGGVCGSSSLL